MRAIVERYFDGDGDEDDVVRRVKELRGMNTGVALVYNLLQLSISHTGRLDSAVAITSKAKRQDGLAAQIIKVVLDLITNEVLTKHRILRDYAVALIQHGVVTQEELEDFVVLGKLFLDLFVLRVFVC